MKVFAIMGPEDVCLSTFSSRREAEYALKHRPSNARIVELEEAKPEKPEPPFTECWLTFWPDGIRSFTENEAHARSSEREQGAKVFKFVYAPEERYKIVIDKDVRP